MGLDLGATVVGLGLVRLWIGPSQGVLSTNRQRGLRTRLLGVCCVGHLGTWGGGAWDADAAGLVVLHRVMLVGRGGVVRAKGSDQATVARNSSRRGPASHNSVV